VCGAYNAMAVRSTKTSMGWLGGTVRLWIALVSLVATVAGIATFAVTEHIAWAWLAIGFLVLLVVSLGWTAKDEYNKRLAGEQNDPRSLVLDRAIANGHVIVRTEYPPLRHSEWREWHDTLYAVLRKDWGLDVAYEFAEAGDRHRDLGQAIASEVAYLESLRDRR
jgi:hypothetical protein